MSDKLLQMGDLPANTIQGTTLTRGTFENMSDLEIIKLVEKTVTDPVTKEFNEKPLKGYLNLPDIDVKRIQKELWKLDMFKKGKHEKFMFKNPNTSDIKVVCVQILLWEYFA